MLGLRCCAGFSLVAGSRGDSPAAVFWLLTTVSSLVLEPELSCYCAQASLLRGMCDLPGSGIELESPALAGGFFPAEPPSGKPLAESLIGGVWGTTTKGFGR